MSFRVTDFSDFKVKELTLQTRLGSFDISTVFDELNIFENMFTPCMSGNIFIRDTNDLINYIELTDTKIIISFEKSDGSPDILDFTKTFVAYKISNRTNVNMGTQTFVLHFVSEDYLKSEKKKNNFRYPGLYSNAIRRILIDDLGVSSDRIASSSGSQTTPAFLTTIGNHDIIIPNMTPFDAIEWLIKRSIPNSPDSSVPDCVFYESKNKFYFTSIGVLSQLAPIFTDGINVRPKNISQASQNDSEMLDAINFKIVQPTNIAENITNGVYAGKFFGWDSLTRLKKTTNYGFYYFWNKSKHFNRYPIIPRQSEEQLVNNYDSRVVVYPFASERRNVGYVTQNNNADATIIDNTEEYVLQRKMIMYNLMQRRVQLTMPGNFGLTVGSVVNLNFPNFVSGMNDMDSLDQSMTGKYVIIAVRHIIRFDRHETIIETATDSTDFI